MGKVLDSRLRGNDGCLGRVLGNRAAMRLVGALLRKESDQQEAAVRVESAGFPPARE